MDHSDTVELEELFPIPATQEQLDRGPASSRVLVRGLSYSHKAMIDHLIAEPWISNNELAARFGRTPSWISTIRASDAFQTQLATRVGEVVDPALRQTVEDRMRGVMLRSVEVLEENLNLPHPPPELALRSLAVTSKALGYGAKLDEKPSTPQVESHLDQHRQRLRILLRQEKSAADGSTTVAVELTHDQDD